MPFISSLKESFAIAPIQDREAVVQKLATANTEDGNYYQGLIILQKLYDEVMKHPEPTKSREATSIERDLSNKMQVLLNKSSFQGDNHLELNTRYHLLIYPFDTLKSVDFIKSGLYLDLMTQKQDQEQVTENNQSETSAAYVLDESLIDGYKVLKKSFDEYQLNGSLDFDVLALPLLKSEILEKNVLSNDEEVTVLKTIFMYPTERVFGNSIMDRLSRLWKLQVTENSGDKTEWWQLENLPFYNFTLSQMDYLIQQIPNIVLLQETFICAYLEKLIPTQYYSRYSTGGSISFWDDDENILENYLKRLETFAGKLPAIYYQFKSAVKFHLLRVDIVRQNFEETNLIQYLASASNNSATSPVPSRITNLFSRNTPNEKFNNRTASVASINIPLLGRCEISEQDKLVVVQEYLAGLVSQDCFTKNIESLGAYMDYHYVLKPLYAKLMLTLTDNSQESWSSVLGSSAFEKLVTESSVSFTPSTLNKSVKRGPDEPVQLSIRTKNIQRLSIRVFQIDMENYSRLHMDSDDETIAKKNNKIDLDGLCPTWEEDIDCSSDPSIRVKTSTFVFGRDGFAPNVFDGRGLWVIEFVGGQNQCRAIVQKGYLRYVIQESIGGHVVRILDEDGRTLENAKIWCGNQYYQPDESNNILIPYLPFDSQSKMSKMLLISNSDEFSEPATFYQLSEDYKLEADFYVNPEMVSFNKKVTVIVNPRLTMNGSPASLSLIEKANLTVKCTNADDVTNSSVCQNISKYPNAVHFEFMVPERLETLEFNLQAKIRTLKDTLETVNVEHRINYASPVDNTGVPASIHLRKDTEDNHFVHAFGKNGESKKNYEVSLKLKHAYVAYRPIEVTLKTNENGFVELGKLKNIQWVEYSNSHGSYKQWLVNNVKQSLLPPAVCISVNTPFKIMRPTLPVSDLLFSLYKTGTREIILEDVSDHIEKTDSHIILSGLQEGEYMLYIASANQGTKQIKCTVIKGQSDNANSEDKNRLWSDWIIGTDSFVKQNGTVLSRPLDISDISVTDNIISVQLQNWTSKAYIVATSNTFVPTSSESLKQLIDNRSLTRPIANDLLSKSIKSQFLDDKKLGEEYQYVLNRSRAEKWVGSNLTKPSLLMYPKKNADTSSDSRQLEVESIMRKNAPFAGLYNSSLSKAKMMGEMAYCTMAGGGSQYTESSLAFLDHDCPVLVIPVTSDGKIDIDRQSFGSGGNFFQVVAISGEQVVSKNMVLPGTFELKMNDLRQKSSSDKALIRSNVVKNLLPTEKLDINTNEYETIDSVEKLFDTIKIISNVGNAVSDLDYLKTWSTLDTEKKLKLHEEKVCHELNLWLKKKDTAFFEQYVRPALKSKVQKSFMDLYLIDSDLSEFSDSIYQYNKLNTAEKALLATTRSREFLQTVLRSFKESFDEKKVDGRSDAIFDSILAGSALSLNYEEPESFAVCAQAVSSYDTTEIAAYAATSPAYSPDSVGFGSSSAPRGALFGSAAPAPVARMAMRASAPPPPPPAQEDEPIDDNSEELEEAANKLREKAKQRQKKVSYEFVKQTSEWVETSYYNESDTLNIKRFWIDYLEYYLNKTGEQNCFLSDNFMYSLDNLTEVLYVLSLTDLPFSSASNWSMEGKLAESIDNMESNAIQLTISTSSNHPLMVFYRTLTESTTPFSASGNSENNLMLGQELFLFDASTPIDSEECIKINPSTSTLEPNIEYGSHVIISNASGKSLTCQVTVQVPTGAVPCKNTPYCRSKTITIDAYSTWHEVTGTFYFPSAGQFTIVPVTVSSLSGDKLLGKIESMNINVENKSSSDKNAEGDNSVQSLSLSSWSALANTGSNGNVFSFLESYKSLDRLDLRLIEWRMKDKDFARQVFNILSKQRHFFSEGLWKYGVYHQFEDIISDLLSFSSMNVLDKTGQVFDSPLVTKQRKDKSDVFDYYPLLNARAHPLKSTSHEILNSEFYREYNNYLGYLGQLTREPSNTDLVVLTLYLILQDRIGEAQSIFSRIQSDGGEDMECQVQIDYLNAYLKTRIPVTSQIEQQSQDLNSIKEIAIKYKGFGVPKWRKLFTNLYDFVCEVEQGDSTLTGDLSRDGALKIQSEPILEFEINQQHQELVVQFANVKAIDVKYYEMNIEVMFSSNPFMNERSTTMLNKENFSWIKPSYTLRVDLPEKQKINAEFEDFDMIGVGQVNSVQTLNIPFSGGNKNMFVEISSVGTPNIIKRRQAHYSHTLHTHIAESFGIVRVLSGKTKRPLAGAYVKVYARMKQGQQIQFWKDGYTGLNGVFDYIRVTEGNALMGGSQTDLKILMDEKVDKLSILIISAEEGAVVKEAYPPLTNY